MLWGVLHAMLQGVQHAIVGAQLRHRLGHGGATGWAGDDIAPDEAALAEGVPAVQADGELLLIIVALETQRAGEAVEVGHLKQWAPWTDERWDNTAKASNRPAA